MNEASGCKPWKTLGAYKVVIYKPKIGFIKSENIRRYKKISLNLEIPMTNKFVDPCIQIFANGDYLHFPQIYSPQLETLGA